MTQLSQPRNPLTPMYRIRTAMGLENPWFKNKLRITTDKPQESYRQSYREAVESHDKATRRLEEDRDESLDQLDKSCAKAARKPLGNLRSLSLSLSLSPPLSLPFHPPWRPGIPDPPDEPNLPPRPLLSFSLRTPGDCQLVL